MTTPSKPTAEGLRVVLGIETSGPGGAEAMVVQLARALSERGADVVVATTRPGWMTERAEAAGLPVWIDAMREGPDPRWVARLRRRLRDERIDLLHSHEFEMNAYGGAAAIAARVPSVATLHGSVAGTERKHLLAYRALGALGQRLVAVSHDLLARLAGPLGRGHRRVRVIHNGTEVPPLLAAEARPDARRRARAELGLPGDGPLFVAIGSLYPVKDHATLLRAAAWLPGARIAIAGRGDEEAALRDLATSLGIADRVHLLGLRDDVPRVLAACDAFVQPSLSEGLPLAVLEAMAHGCAVVATRVGGVAEAVVEGETGLLVPPGDPAKLADALREVANDPALAAAFAEAGWRRAHAEFSTDAMTDRYLALYGELLPGRPGLAREAA